MDNLFCVVYKAARTAKTTLQHHNKQLPAGQLFINQSSLGTAFEGRIVAEIRPGDKKAVVADVRERVQITGIHEFIIDSKDLFQKGYLL